MVLYIIYLILSLALILYACDLFTNGIEWFGKKLNLGQSAIGSVLAAVGTALPETMIPIIAILFGVSANSHEVGIGAIVGAPFMLTTLAFFVTGFAVIFFSSMKKRSIKMDVNAAIMSRDLGFFLIVYTIAVLTSFLPGEKLGITRIIIGILLMSSYAYYVYMSFKDDDDNQHAVKLEELTLTKYFKLKNTMTLIVIQLIVSLTAIVIGAKYFVDNMVGMAESLRVPALILSLILTPIATELPEKFNSIIWIGKKKDTLALGNITGAMVFQSCFPVAFGVVFTDWHLESVTLISAAIALFSGIVNYLYLKIYKTLNPLMLITGGLFYLIFLLYVFTI